MTPIVLKGGYVPSENSYWVNFTDFEILILKNILNYSEEIPIKKNSKKILSWPIFRPKWQK